MTQPPGWRHPIDALRAAVGDLPLAPVLLLATLAGMDEFNRNGMTALLPSLRNHTGMSDAWILMQFALASALALLAVLPVATIADRSNRIPVAIGAVAGWLVLFFIVGGVGSAWFLSGLVQSVSGRGRAVVDPSHGAILADSYDVDHRPAVYSLHRSMTVAGMCLGPLVFGGLASAWGWRPTVFVMVAPTLVVVIAVAVKLKDPIRGAQERRAAGASAEVVATEEPVPTPAEAWRLVWKVEVLRRIWRAMPFFAVAFIGFATLSSFVYERLYHYSAVRRGVVLSIVAPFELVGLIIGAKACAQPMRRNRSAVFRYLRTTAAISAVAVGLFALAPNAPLTIVANIFVNMALAALIPGLLAVLSMAIPPRTRAMGFAVTGVCVIPGLVILPLIGWMADGVSIRWGLALLVPVLAIGAIVVAYGGEVVTADIEATWAGAVERSEALVGRAAGTVPLVSIRNLDVSYGPVQILFDVSLDVAEGEVVALLGTNGAGKSTLLRAISGVVEADAGVVLFDGRDITHAPPYEIAAHGLSQMPGGAATFPTLTVTENLRCASWLARRHKTETAAEIDRLLDVFPVLRERIDEPAANLSGGQQQMLGLAMSLLSRPRLLMIDELSLGLAPVVVEQLAEIVRDIAAQGTTVILVEQSVNVALTLAKTAHFMEKGQIRFSGQTAELLERPDILRSVFLGGLVPVADPSPVGESGGRTISVREPTPTPEQAAGVLPALHIDGVTCSFGGIRAVDEVTLSVAPGEIVGLIGPNGAGKTTLLDVISGFTHMDRGRIQLDGRDISTASPQRRAQAGLGRSFQDARLFSSLTVDECLAVAYDRWVTVKDPINPMLRLPAAIQSEDRVADRVDQLVERFGLGPHRNRFIAELSTGTRRMVDLAGVVAHSPTVLLLDEPSSGIAQRESEALGPLIKLLRDELGCTILVVEHDMPLLRGIADRLVALDMGAVVTDGTPDEVLTHPAVIESYLGTSAAVIARSGARS
jgi:ABC-type branched-subunit amino acid transport system ATPase component/MFS family permease